MNIFMYKLNYEFGFQITFFLHRFLCYRVFFIVQIICGDSLVVVYLFYNIRFMQPNGFYLSHNLQYHLCVFVIVFFLQGRRWRSFNNNTCAYLGQRNKLKKKREKKETIYGMFSKSLNMSIELIQAK